MKEWDVEGQFNNSLSNSYHSFNWLLIFINLQFLLHLLGSQHSGNDSNDVENNNNRNRSYKRSKDSKEPRLSSGGNDSSNGLNNSSNLQEEETDDEDGIDFKCVVCDLQCQDIEQWVIVCIANWFTFHFHTNKKPPKRLTCKGFL